MIDWLVTGDYIPAFGQGAVLDSNRLQITLYTVQQCHRYRQGPYLTNHDCSTVSFHTLQCTPDLFLSETAFHTEALKGRCSIKQIEHKQTPKTLTCAWSTCQVQQQPLHDAALTSPSWRQQLLEPLSTQCAIQFSLISVIKNCMQAFTQIRTASGRPYMQPPATAVLYQPLSTSA